MTEASTAPPATGTVPVAQSRMRSGVAVDGPNNLVLDPLPAGSYPATKQCVGERVTLQSGATNIWWVQITAQGKTGWVSAVVITVGGNNQPIANVPQAPTVNI